MRGLRLQAERDPPGEGRPQAEAAARAEEQPRACGERGAVLTSPRHRLAGMGYRKMMVRWQRPDHGGQRRGAGECSAGWACGNTVPATRRSDSGNLLSHSPEITVPAGFGPSEVARENPLRLSQPSGDSLALFGL